MRCFSSLLRFPRLKGIAPSSHHLSFWSCSPAAPATLCHGGSLCHQAVRPGQSGPFACPPHHHARSVPSSGRWWRDDFVGDSVCPSGVRLPWPAAGLGARDTPENRTDIAPAPSGRAWGGGSGRGSTSFSSCLLDVLNSQSQDGGSSLLRPSFIPPDRHSRSGGADSVPAPRAVGKAGRQFSRQHFLFS